jgi:hypothetical protein
VCPVSEKRYTFFKNRTDGQDRCRHGNNCLVIGKIVLDPILLEHYRKYTPDIWFDSDKPSKLLMIPRGKA